MLGTPDRLCEALLGPQRGNDPLRAERRILDATYP